MEEIKTIELSTTAINLLKEAVLWYINSAEFNDDTPEEVMEELPNFQTLLNYLKSI